MGNRKGFTLIELLVVIGILAVLLAITLIAVNPAEQLQRSDDTKRQSDVTQILNAINQYMVDNNGIVPGVITGTAADIGNGVGEANLCALLVPQYIAALPQDPASNNGADITDCVAVHNTGYQVVTTNNRVTVSADAANNPPVEATR
jgi:type IV pilus assembly protein PilA